MAYHLLNHNVEEIRLLQLVKPPDDVDPDLPPDQVPIHCTLDHYPINDKHRLPTWSPRYNPKKRSQYVWGEYIALSYTWGKKGVTREIIVNGKGALVTRNLEHALRALRDRAGYGTHIWVDSLCIDQESLPERNREVGRMKIIYKRAADVWIWLGDEEPGSKEAFAFVKDLGPAWKASPEEFRQVLRRTLIKYGPSIWKSFVGILARDYWYRLWVMQEMAMGTDRGPILCGGDKVEWGHFIDTILGFNHSNDDQSSTLKKIVNEELNAEHRATLHALRVYWTWDLFWYFDQYKLVQQGQGEPNYEQIMVSLRAAQCTETRDKVYGILGLMTQRFAEFIEPDYNLPLVEVYKQFTVAWFKDREDLEILGCCGARLNDDFPSWIPDLRFRFYRMLTAPSPQEPNYNAPGDLKPYWSVDRLSLTVRGILVDRVDGLGSGNWASSEVEVFGKWTVKQSKENSNIYGSHEAMQDAIWRSYVMDRSLEATKAPQSYQYLLDKNMLDEPDGKDPMEDVPDATERFNEQRQRIEIRTEENIRRNLRVVLKRSRGLKVGGKPLEEYLTDPHQVKPEIDWARYKDAVDRVDRCSWSRRFGTTVKGYVGLFPNESRPGDVVAIIAGCNCPILLRPHGDEYKIVDPTYLHGIMEGEIIEGSGKDVQDIVLV